VQRPSPTAIGHHLHATEGALLNRLIQNGHIINTSTRRIFCPVSNRERSEAAASEKASATEWKGGAFISSQCSKVQSAL